jgi:hypothetical protein
VEVIPRSKGVAGNVLLPLGLGPARMARLAGSADVLGLLLLYRVGWGNYARFWRGKSSVFMGCLAVLGMAGA